LAGTLFSLKKGALAPFLLHPALLSRKNGVPVILFKEGVLTKSSKLSSSKGVASSGLIAQRYMSQKILAQWQRPVASSETLDLLHRAMRVVTYRCTALAIKMASKIGVFINCCLFAVALVVAGAIRSK
jgi:hypothetical protein